MRTSIWLVVALAGVMWSGCSAGSKGASVSNRGSSGSTGSGGQGSGSNGNGGSGAGLTIPKIDDPNVPGEVEDPDPGNPNITHAKCGPGTCTDFPADPIMGDGVPPNVAQLFGAATEFTAGGLCVLEPQLSADGKPGAMLPANWVRPRFRVAAPTGIDVLEIRLHSPAEKNDLVAYTLYKPGATSPSWYLPKEIWSGMGGMNVPAAGNGFANNAAGQPVTVTIRGINSSAPGKPVGMSGDFNIAPVVATGSMVFWTVNSSEVTLKSSKLLGFAVGDEGVAESLTLPQVQWTGQIGEDNGVLRGAYDMPKLLDIPDGTVRCVGCHTSLPDGSGVIFTDDWPWAKAAASLTQGSVGAIPTVIASGAQAIMKMPWWGTQTLSPGHWMPGDHTLVTSFGATFKSGTARTKAWNKLPSYEQGNQDKIKWHQLAWIDLESTAAIDVTPPIGYNAAADAREAAAMAAKGTGWGIIATGDTGVSDVTPSLTHKGDKIVYVTTDYSPDGHADTTAKTADLRTVDYNNRMGGVSQPVAGASDPAQLEYYPAYSADDRFITFNRAPAPSAQSPDGPYYNRFGQIMVIPAAGGTATPLAANDPVACAGDNVSAGIINSWPKWSPDAVTVNGKTYYFLVFSSARKYGDEFSQPFTLPSNPLSGFTGLNNSSQLYLAAVVVDEATQQITTYPAVYIWNQNRAGGDGGATGLRYSNLTPAWDPIKLPPLMIPEVHNDPPK